MADKNLPLSPDYLKDAEPIEEETTGLGEPPEPPKSLRDFMLNRAPTSLYQYGMDILGGIGALSPYGTKEGQESFGWRIPPAVTGAKQLAVGGLASTLPPEVQAGFPDVQTFNNVVDFYKNRYGSVQKALDTAYKDPFGTLADVSTATSVAGGGLRAGATVVPKLAKAAEVAETVARETAPLAQIKRAGAMVASPMLEKGAEHLYGAGLRPSGTKRGLKTAGSQGVLTGTGKTLTKAETALEKVHTGIKEQIPLNWAGAQKAYDLIDGINDEISSMIKTSDQSGNFIPSYKVIQRLDELEKQVSKSPLPQKALDEIAAAKKEFLTSHGAILGMEQAQEIKKYGGKLARNKYGDLSSSQVEIQKALVRGLKEEIAARLPEITGLNARESRLIALSDDLDKFLVNQVKRPAFKGISRMAVIFGSVPALVMDLINLPSFQSHMALAMANVAKGQVRAGRGAAALSSLGKIPLSTTAPISLDVGMPEPPASMLPEYEEGGQP